MPVPLPNLDTRRWIDLVDEGRALIPRHAPEWTDFNVHDPGITVVELLAWLVEQDLYRANRVTSRHRAKFLKLVGFAPRAARPAHAVLTIEPSAAGSGVTIPAGVAFTAITAARRLTFRTEVPLQLFGGQLTAIVSWTGTSFVDLTATTGNGSDVEAFGPDPVSSAGDPESGSALYLGFDAPLVGGATVSLWLWLDGAGASDEEQRRAAEERAARDEARAIACRPPGDIDACVDVGAGGHALDEFHRSATASAGASDRGSVAWEYWDGNAWQALDPAAGDVEDGTDGLRYSGAVQLRPPSTGAARLLGPISAPTHFVRARHVAGRFDRAPRLRRVTVDAVSARQSEPAWAFVGPGQRALDPDGEQGAIVGISDGRPGQRFALPGLAVAEDAVRVSVGGMVGTDRWRVVADLDASAWDDADVALDEHALSFGDGRRGRVPPGEGDVLAVFEATAGSLGTVPPGGRWDLLAGEINEAILGSAAAVDAMAGAIGGIANPEGAAPGSDRETLEHAAGRAAERLWSHERLVELAEESGVETLDRVRRPRVLTRAAPPRATTLLDLERLALDLPGGRVARARAFAGVDPDVPCRRAPGTVMVVAIPWLPRGRPAPTGALLDDLSAYLERRRVLGMRLVVLGPRYVEVGVQAQVAVDSGTDPDAVMDRIGLDVARFLDPLEGGAAGGGWPFGRDVYRAELLAVIDGVTGVDYVRRLRITATPVDDGAGGNGTVEPSCGNVCLGPARLPVLGPLAIEVVE